MGSGAISCQRFTSMSPQLSEFLRYGRLPFLGREEEMERLLGFWQETANAEGARVMVMTGEGGIGKSRLTEAVMREIASRGGVTVRVTLYPGASTPIAHLLDEGIRAAGREGSASPNGSVPTLADTAFALRRMSHLRPTLLIIDDLHLLGAASLADLNTLLSMLAEEPLSILCSARFLSDPVRGLLDRYQVDEITLAGLDEGALDQMWRTLFGHSPDPLVVDALFWSTRGNPLALRSGLRGALASGAIGQVGERWRIGVEHDLFRAGLERSAQLVSEGMAAHLTAEEWNTAATLATLGELFSRTTAVRLLGDAAGVDLLLDRGIIALSHAHRAPLSGRGDGTLPLCFTHTLLHRQLSEHHSADPNLLVEIVAENLPLYSIQPFEEIAEHAAQVTLPFDVLHCFIRESITVAAVLDLTNEWECTTAVWTAASLVFHTHAEGWPNPERRELEAGLLAHRLGLHRRENHTEQHARWVEQLLELTDSAETPTLARHRLSGLRFYRWVEFRTAPDRFSADWEQVESLILKHPGVVRSDQYIAYLSDLAALAVAQSRIDIVRQVESRLDGVMTDPEIDEELRLKAFRQISTYFIMIFDSPEELAARRALLDRLEALDGSPTISLRLAKLRLLEEAGWYDEVISAAHEMMPMLRTIGLTVSYYTTSMIEIVAQTTVGGTIESALERVRTLQADAPSDVTRRMPLESGLRFAALALLRGEKDVARQVIEGLPAASPDWNILPITLALLENDYDRAYALAAEDRGEMSAVRALGSLALKNLSGGEMEEVGRFLERPLLRVTDLLVFHACVGLLLTPRLEEARHQLADRLSVALRGAFEWFAERRLSDLMTSMLDRFSSALGASESASWRERVEEIAGARAKESMRENNERPTLVMIGRIELVRQDGSRIGLGSGRLRTLLGALVADCMMPRRLEQDEFRTIVAGEEGGAERARKGMNLAVHRLRELIGRDAIDTSEGTPRLEAARFRVDLLEAHAALTRARKALREHRPLLAHSSVLQTLGIVGSEVILPGLYHEFFEAVRVEFEYQLRSVVLTLGRQLLDDGGAEMAEQLLRPAAAALRNDEEIAELFRGVLIQRGEHVEAERMRMQSEGVEARNEKRRVKEL